MENQMTAPLLDILRCPYSGLPLHSEGDQVYSEEHSFSKTEGLLNLVHADRVASIDKLFQKQYGRKTAEKYDRVLKIQSLLFGCSEAAERRKLARLLNPPPQAAILEVGVGTGANLPHLAGAVKGGRLVGVDLSLAMLKVAEKRARNIPLPVDLIRADGCSLPFASDSFDAVFHFGGINMFGDIEKGICEMIRVAKPGAPLIISDEGMSERRRQTRIGRLVARLNSLYLCRPPFETLPWDSISRFRLHWAWRELFYVFLFFKGRQEQDASPKNAREEVFRRIGLKTQ